MLDRSATVLWDLYQQYQIGQLDRKLDRANDDIATGAATARVAMRLDEKVDRLALLCQAMFELLQQTSGVTEEQLKAKVQEIDLRDGQADGRVTPKAKACPTCGALMPPQLGGCQFCGYRDPSSTPFTGP